jgi:hypothetical protein
MLVVLSLIPTVVNAEDDVAASDRYDLVDRLTDLQEVVADIAEQYAAITSRIDFIQQRLTEGQETVLKEETIKKSDPNFAESYYSMLNFFSEGSENRLCGLITSRKMNSKNWLLCSTTYLTALKVFPIRSREYRPRYRR